MSLSRSFVHSVVASDDPLLSTQLGCGGIADLFSIYASSGSVRGLGIRGFNITRGACCELAMSIRNLSNRTLQLLDLACCTVGDKGAIQLMRALSETTGECREFALRLCHLTPAFGKDLGRLFHSTLTRRTAGINCSRRRVFGNLHAMDLSFNALQCSGVAALLQHAPTGLQLDLSYTGLESDACDGDGLRRLETALNETEASSVLLFGAGKLVTEHLRRVRRLGQSRKQRQQLVDAKCIVGRARGHGEDQPTFANNSDPEGNFVGGAEAGIVETTGVPEASERPDLQWCRPGSASVTVFLDGDLNGLPDPAQMVATSKFLGAYADWVKEQQQQESKEKDDHGADADDAGAPPASPGDGSGGARTAHVANDAPSWDAQLLREMVTVTGEPLVSIPSYRQGCHYPAFVRGEIAGVSRVRDGRGSSAAVFSARSASCISTGGPAALARSASAGGRTARSCSAGGGNFTGRSGSAYGRSASAGGGGAPPTARSNSAVSSVVTPSAAFARSESVVSSSVMSHLPYSEQQYTARTPFSIQAVPPTLSATSRSRFNKTLRTSNQQQQQQQQPKKTVAEDKQQQQPQEKKKEDVEIEEQEQPPGTKSREIIASARTEPPAPTSPVQISKAHMSPRSCVAKGRVLLSITAKGRAVRLDSGPDERVILMKRLLAAAAVSDSQASKIFGWPVAKHLAANAEAPPSLRSDVALPDVLRQASGIASHLARHTLGSEIRVAGLAKILFFLAFCDLPLLQEPSKAEAAQPWLADADIDLPVFLRSFGDSQRTVVKFRHQRTREDAAARETVHQLLDDAVRQQEEQEADEAPAAAVSSPEQQATERNEASTA